MSLLTPRNITLGMIAAAFTNLAGIPLFSLGYTNTLMSSLYPAVFSTFSLVCIQLWGLAYLSVARSYAQVPWLLAVFALEKFAYVLTWIAWIKSNGAQLPQIFEQSFVTGAFYSVYGIVDLTFGIFFAVVAMTSSRRAG